MVARQLAQKLSFQEDDSTIPVDGYGNIDEEAMDKDPVAVSYSTYATTIYRAAKKARDDTEYSEPLPMKEIYFVLPEKMTGSNVAFNEGMSFVLMLYYSFTIYVL